MKIDTGEPFLHRGEWGARVTVQFDDKDGGHGSYDLTSRGKTHGQLQTEIAQLKKTHRDRMKRHNDLAAVRGSQIAGGWTITDSYVDRRGSEHHLHVIAWNADHSEWIDFEATHPDPSQLPDNATVVAALTQKVGAHSTAKAEHAAMLKTLG